MAQYLLISDAAKEVQVESHVLRYWEEELHLPIKRNELGHRYYTEEDVECFKQIKRMKEKGLQLKAIKMVLKDGNLDVIGVEEKGMAIEILGSRDITKQEENMMLCESTKEAKAKRLQWLLQQMMREVVQESNQELCRDIKESILKELDYQFRMQEEREDAREGARIERDEEHYRKMDELLRVKNKPKLKVERKKLFRKREA